jgi:LuxR family maltose regulon positive regulatory protein
MKQNIELLSTKLHIPRLHSNLLARPRLIEQLNQVAEYKLMLISAPAGFGKTTLLSEWIAANQNSSLRFAWVSLDESDNDPIHFWSYFIAALEELHPEIGKNARSLLQTSSPTLPWESILTTLLNEVNTAFPLNPASEAGPVEIVLVLDDYHLIKLPAVHSKLEYVLDHLPSQLHLVLATRSDPSLPLPRLRVRRQLNEIREAQLRFTLAETTGFLNQLNDLKLSSQDITRLEMRTEGWIAGLQLAALSLQNQTDTSGFIQAFSGGHRYVLDYLAQEVFEQQEVKVQNFLLQTSLLNRLSAELCRAVTGIDESQELLNYLEKSNLFVVSLDENRHWYRYHHLFRDFLRGSLRRQAMPELISELHQKAANWYQQRGLVQEAIEHLLVNISFEQATALIEKEARGLWMRGEALTLLRWLEALPEELIRQKPQLGMFYTWSLIASNRLDEAEQRLVQAAQTLKSDPALTAELEAELLTLQATLARFQEDIPATIKLSNQALEKLAPGDRLLQSVVALNLGHAYRISGEVVRGCEAFEESVRVGRAVNNNYIVLFALNNLAQLEVIGGKLHQALEHAEQSLQFAQSCGMEHLPMMSQAYYEAGQVLYQWNEPDRAFAYLQKALELGQRSLLIKYQIQSYQGMARVLLARGEPEQGIKVLDKALELAQEHRASALFNQVNAQKLRVSLTLNKSVLDNDWLENRQLTNADLPHYQQEFEYLTLVRILLFKGKAKEALELIEPIYQKAISAGRISVVIETLILQTLAKETLNQKTQALFALQQALKLAEPERFIRIFLDEGATILNLLQQLSSSLHIFTIGRKEQLMPRLLK